MSKQDIAIPRTVQAVERRVQSVAPAIERKVESTFLKNDPAQIREHLKNAASNVGWAIENGCFHSEQGEEIEKTTSTPMGEITVTTYLFYYMSIKGLRFRICKTNNFNDIVTDLNGESQDYSIWKITQFMN